MSKRSIFIILFTIVTTLVYSQTPSPDSAIYARIVYLKPKEGKVKEFEDGYKRHLGWHKENKETWTWYGWTNISGERWGHFMDGTFFRSLEEFENPINPSGDIEHNWLNVFPFADVQSAITLKYISSTSKQRKDTINSRFLKIYTVDILAGKAAQFLSALTEIIKTTPISCMTFQVIDGDTVPRYFIFIPYSSLRQIAYAENLFYSDIKSDLSSIIKSIKVETVRYRPDLSLIINKK